MHKIRRTRGKISEGGQSDHELKDLLARHIQKVRKRRDMTARQVAEGIGLSRTALTQMENGHNHFNAVTLYKLASFLKCDIKELFPSVPDSTSLTEADVAAVAKENEEAAKLLLKAFKKK